MPLKRIASWFTAFPERWRRKRGDKQKEIAAKELDTLAGRSHSKYSEPPEVLKRRAANQAVGEVREFQRTRSLGILRRTPLESYVTAGIQNTLVAFQKAIPSEAMLESLAQKGITSRPEIMPQKVGSRPDEFLHNIGPHLFKQLIIGEEYAGALKNERVICVGKVTLNHVVNDEHGQRSFLDEENNVAFFMKKQA